MKSKSTLLPVLISASLLVSATAFAGGPGGRGGGPMRAGTGTTVSPRNPNSTGTPLKDGSGKATAPGKGASADVKGNPNSTGTPLKDGSGKATAPGKGAKDGTGNQANCPNKP